MLTLFGALPIYNRVAEESPHGEGSISMLEHLLSRWKGKLFVLVLLGFVATDFVITITLSAADATAHIIENPFTPPLLKHQIGVTIALIAVLGAIFLKGFKEAIGIAVALVAVYLVLASLFSRVYRTTELRVDQIELDDQARQFIKDAARGTIRIITNRRDEGDADEYVQKEQEKRSSNHIPPGEPILFFEVTPGDASEFAGKLAICGETVGNYRILRTESAAVPNAIAAFLLYLRDEMGKLPHVYFGWSAGNPISYLLKYIAFGEGDTAPVTHEVLRKAERDPNRRPIVHVGG